MEHLNAGRVLMADSLGFHILFVILGIGLPLMMSIFEFIAIRRKDNALRETTRLWSYIAGILVITGVISGTVVALQMFLIWPGILEFGGKVISPAFMLEGYAFLIEAIFLAFYIKTWDKFKGYGHWLIGLPVFLGATASAYLITAVDSFMNHPTGFEYVNGQIVNPHPWQAIFSTTAILQFSHSILAYYLTAALVVVGVYAWVMFAGKKFKVGDVKLAQFIIKRSMLIALALMLMIMVLGDLSGKYLAHHEPTKLAAIELQHTTGANAPFVLGGTLNEDGTVSGGITVPNLLSVMVGESPNTVIKGLEEVSKAEWPPLVIHTLFSIKMVVMGILVTLLFAYAAAIFWFKKHRFTKPTLVYLMAAPILSALAVELGWMVTEMGRQPYSVFGYVLTKQAFTKSQGVLALGWLFPTVFLILLVLTVIAVLLFIKRYQPKKGRA